MFVAVIRVAMTTSVMATLVVAEMMVNMVTMGWFGEWQKQLGRG